MKKIIICFLVIFTVLSSRAQTSIAVTAGIQRTSVTPDFLVYPDTLKKSSSLKAGIILGFIANVPITKHLFFHTGILYAAKGSNQTQFYDTANLYANTINLPASQKQKKLSINTRLNISYIDVPLNIIYKSSGKGKSSFFIGAGPQLSLFYSGTNHTQTINVSQDSLGANRVRLYFKESENNDLPVGKVSGKYRVVHFGVNAFAGVEFSKVFFRINYTRDLNEFYEEEGRKYMNKTVGIGMGIYLGKRTTERANKKL